MTRPTRSGRENFIASSLLYHYQSGQGSAARVVGWARPSPGVRRLGLGFPHRPSRHSEPREAAMLLSRTLNMHSVELPAMLPNLCTEGMDLFLPRHRCRRGREEGGASAIFEALASDSPPKFLDRLVGRRAFFQPIPIPPLPSPAHDGQPNSAWAFATPEQGHGSA